MSITIVRAVSLVAAVFHHKIFSAASNTSSFDVRPDAPAAVVGTARTFQSYIENGK